MMKDKIKTVKGRLGYSQEVFPVDEALFRAGREDVIEWINKMSKLNHYIFVRKLDEVLWQVQQREWKKEGVK